MKRIILLFTICTLLFSSCALQKREPLQIVFTNDTHSQVEPLKGKGGYEAWSAVLDSLRQVNPNTLLLDAGDIWQGTPYFNLFKGRIEVEAYNLMGYEAMTLGNHEFDNGLDTLAARIDEMNFPVVCANYEVNNTPLEGKVRPYTIIEKNGWKIGIIGVSVNPKGLILDSNIEGVKYTDPIAAVNKYADILRNEKKCNLVIVLSHLGLHDDTIFGNVADDTMAPNIKNVDFILGGHTHQFHGVFDYKDAEGKIVKTIQEQKSGLKLYSITIE